MDLTSVPGPERAIGPTDGSQLWSDIVVHIVLGGPARKSLLFAGTQTSVFVSFNDGFHWQDFQLTLPTASAPDLVIYGADLIAGTHGHSIWILDHLAPLRQIDSNMAAADVWLFRPTTA